METHLYHELKRVQGEHHRRAAREGPRIESGAGLFEKGCFFSGNRLRSRAWDRRTVSNWTRN